MYQIKLKLNRAVDILSKRCSHSKLNSLGIAYYSLFQPAVCCTTMESEKSRNQANIVETPKSCFQKN